MIAAIADIWCFDAPSGVETGPDCQRRHAPVLMGDILMDRRGEPELLIRWREDAQTPDEPQP